MSGMRRVRWLLPLLLVLLSACGPRLPGDARIPSGAWISHRAVFIGTNSHDTVGTVSLYQSRSYPVVVFEPNFRVSGAGETVVTLGTNGMRGETVLGTLVKPSGRQAYAVPRHFDMSRFNEVWLWSRSKGEPVGLARLTPI